MTSVDIYDGQFYLKRTEMYSEWYSSEPSFPKVRFLTLDLVHLNKMMDIKFDMRSKQICQIVPTLPLARHHLQFDYILSIKMIYLK